MTTIMTDKRTSEFPVIAVEVVVAYQTSQGIQEVINTVNGNNVQIASCKHEIVRKFKAAKDENGNISGTEPTGEEELILRVKYFRG